MRGDNGDPGRLQLMNLFMGVLVLAALSMIVTLWAVRRHERRGGRINPLWGIGFLWVALSTLYLTASFEEQPPDDFDLACRVPGKDSEFGSSTWQSWPPGPVCRDAEGRVISRPGFREGANIVIAAAGSVGFVIAGGLAVRTTLVRHRRHRVA